MLTLAKFYMAFLFGVAVVLAAVVAIVIYCPVSLICLPFKESERNQ